MDKNGDYRILVHSDGHCLRVGVEGDLEAASRDLHEMRLAAQKLGIAVLVDGHSQRSPEHSV